MGVITQKRQTSMLLVFSLLSPDGKFEQEFIENYMKINVIPQIQRVNGVGDAMVMGADYLCVSGLSQTPWHSTTLCLPM